MPNKPIFVAALIVGLISPLAGCLEDDLAGTPCAEDEQGETKCESFGWLGGQHRIYECRQSSSSFDFVWVLVTECNSNESCDTDIFGNWTCYWDPD